MQGFYFFFLFYFFTVLAGSVVSFLTFPVIDGFSMGEERARGKFEF